jgi:hypothetical protein
MKILAIMDEVKQKTAVPVTCEAIIKELKLLGHEVYVSHYPLLDGPDVILTLYSMSGIKNNVDTGIPIVAYHGDIPPVNLKAYFKNFELFTGKKPTLRNKIGQWLEVRRLKKDHWNLMKKVDVIANVTFCNADYYTQLGHKRSIYIGNTWKQ